MINIDDKLISDDVVEKQFVCNLKKCKGACCWQGDFGAPLSLEEISVIENNLDVIKEVLPQRSIDYITEKGFHARYDEDQFKGTAIHEDGSCVFLTTEDGIAKCGIEKTFRDGKQSFHKPISCHLYPIRVKKDNNTGVQLINYDKWDICKDACSLGEELQVPVYKFAEEALVRKYGQEFYDRLDDIAMQLYQ